MIPSGQSNLNKNYSVAEICWSIEINGKIMIKELHKDIKYGI